MQRIPERSGKQPAEQGQVRWNCGVKIQTIANLVGSVSTSTQRILFNKDRPWILFNKDEPIDAHVRLDNIRNFSVRYTVNKTLYNYGCHVSHRSI